MDVLCTICGQFVDEMLTFTENVDKMWATCCVPQLSNSTNFSFVPGYTDTREYVQDSVKILHRFGEIACSVLGLHAN